MTYCLQKTLVAVVAVAVVGAVVAAVAAVVVVGRRVVVGLRC